MNLKLNITITFFGLLLIIIFDGFYSYLFQNNKKLFWNGLKNVNATIIILIYLIIVINIQIFVLNRPDINFNNVIYYGLTLGFAIYGISNLLYYNQHMSSYTIVERDIIWGMILTGLTSYSLLRIKSVM